MADLISDTAGHIPAAKIDLVASTRSFIVGLGGALTGITAMMYACGYLVTRAHLNLLGLYGLIEFSHDYILQEGAKFFLATAYSTGREILYPASTVILLLLPVILLALFVRKHAQRGWDRLRSRFPHVDAERWLRVVAFVALSTAFVEHSETYLNKFEHPLCFSNLLYLDTDTPNCSVPIARKGDGLKAALIRSDKQTLDSAFHDLAIGLLQALILAYLTWRVTMPWRWHLSLPPIREDTIARLAVDGANAFINGVQVPHGVYVRDGDTVTTGPNTSVTVVLNSGASIQLDQNTDPLFRAIRQGVCVLMELVRGQAAVATGGTCVEFRTARLNADGVAHSILNIRAGESEMRVTVVEGQVDMQSPGAAALHANEEYTSTQYGAWKVRQMTPGEAAASTDWTHTYFRPRASQRKPDYTIPAIVAGAAALLLLRDHGDNHPPASGPDSHTGPAHGRGTPQPAPAAPATPAVPPYGPRPAGPAAGIPAQRSGLCCLPGGGSTQASPLACTARQGQFYPAGTSPGVCPSPVR